MLRGPARPRRAGGATTLGSPKPIATAAAANGTTGCWPMSTASGPTPSGSTACSGMPGNGLGIAGIGISLARRRTAARGPKRLATSMSFVGDRGAICQSSCAQPRAAAAASTAETMTIPVSPAFASRATCRRRTTSATCLVGSDRGPCPSRCRNGRREAKSATTTAPHCGRSVRLRHTWDRWRGRCLRFRLSARPRPS